jgi:4a-hydroxytetrahydrobiopterin dehydratase
MAHSLIQQKCQKLPKGTPALTEKEIQLFFEQLESGWQIQSHHLIKDYLFKNFAEALAFTNRVSALAEEEDHHPDILLTYGKVKITLLTHSIKALSKNDFILAAKCDLI